MEQTEPMEEAVQAARQDTVSLWWLHAMVWITAVCLACCNPAGEQFDGTPSSASSSDSNTPPPGESATGWTSIQAQPEEIDPGVQATPFVPGSQSQPAPDEPGPPAPSTPERTDEDGRVPPESDVPGASGGDDFSSPTQEDEPEPELLPGEPGYCENAPQKLGGAAQPFVYYGTSAPQHVPLTEGQIFAIGNFYGCTGTLITPEWVLTASHCGLWYGSQFCVGSQAANANICFGASQIVDHPSADMTLFRIDQDATQALAGLQPIPLFGDELDWSWVGVLAEAAGYGEQETGWSGEREFTAEPIAYLGYDTVTIDGQGKHGVCFGDSGGPLMVIADDGTVRVAGALSQGDGSCVGLDDFTRVDVYRDWIESYTGPTLPPGPQPCGDMDSVGECNPQGTIATFCGDDGMLSVQKCPQGYNCTWYDVVEGWRCVEQSLDPCAGETYHGSCQQNTLTWCEQGVLKIRDCGACGESCVPDPNLGNICVPSECGALDYHGECKDSVLTWCNADGEIESKDCFWEEWKTCGWIDEQVGYNCVSFF